jgi:hypothetical protein
MEKEALEGGTPQAEVAEPKAEAKETQPEGGEPTATEAQPTVKTFTQEDFDRALGKSLESINQQLSLRQREMEAAKAEAEQRKIELDAANAQLKVLQEEQEKLVRGQDDPELFKSYTDRVALALEKVAVAREKAEATAIKAEAERLAWAGKMAKRAIELAQESGIPASELEACQSEAEMEIKALRYKLSKVAEAKPEKKEPEGEKTPPEFDGGVSSGPAGRRSFTRQQIAEMSIEEYEKIKSEVDEARKAGRIK